MINAIDIKFFNFSFDFEIKKNIHFFEIKSYNFKSKNECWNLAKKNYGHSWPLQFLSKIKKKSFLLKIPGRRTLENSKIDKCGIFNKKNTDRFLTFGLSYVKKIVQIFIFVNFFIHYLTTLILSKNQFRFNLKEKLEDSEGPPSFSSQVFRYFYA